MTNRKNVIADRYEVVSHIGQGGMADVFLAVDTILNRQVAIKILRADLSTDAVSILRFEREAQAAAALAHPNIVEIYDVGDYKGHHYIVMEYVTGKTLKQVIRSRGPLVNEEAVDIMKQLCSAISEAHSRGIIHRDIKPENIVITHGGEVAFIDFGTMRSYKKDSQRDTFVVGTRGTAAPEQYGYNQTDQRTDVYAIGRTMLYMATESYELDQILECGVNRELKKIIKKACSFEPDKRYADAAELGRAIEKCQENNKKNGYKKAGAVVGLIAAGYVLAILFPGTTVIKNGRIIADNNVTENQISAENTQEEETDQNTEQSQDPEQISDAKQSQNNKIIFKEELIEAAVRKELNLSETDEITADMLENVRKLRIVGKEILDDEDCFWGIGHHIDGKDNNFGSVRGSITDLSDLTQMTNLEELALCNQRIEDISGLKDLPLKELYLSKNMITDFSVIQSLIDLDILCILENPAVDLSPLGDCGNISQLNIQGMHLTDIDFLKNMNLNYLDMNNAEVENGIFEPKKLKKKYLYTRMVSLMSF